MKIVKDGQLVEFSFPVVVTPFKGATTTAEGKQGSVPAPKVTDKDKFLKGDGTWESPANTQYGEATTTQSGLISSKDKTKLNGIAEGANKTIVDVALNNSSVNPVQNKIVKAELDKKAPLANANLTGTPTVPTASNSVNTTQIANTAFVHSVVNEKIAAADAMIFKGTLGTGGNITALPATHKTGWAYKVIVAGTYAGQKCGIGDLVVCLVDGTVAKDSDWTVVQTNVDGVVTGPASSVANRVAVFDGATGKVIKDSGFTIATSVPSGAKFTDTVYSHPTNHPATMITGLAKVATSGSYNDLTNRPTSLPANGGNSSTVNGHTVLSNVPANAKFTDTTYVNATTAKAGLMSNTDKVKLDGINITSGTQDLQAGVSPLANGTIYLVYE